MLNDKMERELAYVVKIDAIQPIEGADKVELAIVGGWRVMVRKDQFKPGDLAIYFEIDSKVPVKPEFEFLAAKHYKVKTQKYFKGTVISQGLLMAAEDFGWYVNDDRTAIVETNAKNNDGYHELGDFLTKRLGVTYAEAEDNKRKANSVDKYKKMAQRHGKLFSKQPFRWLMKRAWGRKLLFAFFGKKKDKKSGWPAWVKKTDEERIQNMSWILENKEPWIATEKIDGTSTTFTMKKGKFGKNDFYVCSRNVVFDKPDKNCYYDTNVYIEMAQKYDVENILKKLIKTYDLEWVTLQGETFGASIQKRDYGMKDHDFYGFNLIFSDRGRLGTVESAEIMKEFGITWVPIIDTEFILPDTVDELLAYATDKSKVDGGMREGVVFRSPDGTQSFKAVSNEFLLKYHS